MKNVSPACATAARHTSASASFNTDSALSCCIEKAGPLLAAASWGSILNRVNPDLAKRVYRLASAQPPSLTPAPNTPGVSNLFLISGGKGKLTR